MERGRDATPTCHGPILSSACGKQHVPRVQDEAIHSPTDAIRWVHSSKGDAGSSSSVGWAQHFLAPHRVTFVPKVDALASRSTRKRHCSSPQLPATTHLTRQAKTVRPRPFAAQLPRLIRSGPITTADERHSQETHTMTYHCSTQARRCRALRQRQPSCVCEPRAGLVRASNPR